MAVLTEDQFAQKWAGKFADNTIQNFDEPLFREFKEDIKDSFVPVAATSDVAHNAVFAGQDAGITSFKLSAAVRDKTRLRLQRFGNAALLKSLPALPLPADRPTTIAAPGHVLTLAAAGARALGSPEISEFGRGAAAGQSIWATGEQLTGATAAVYANGQLLEAPVSGNTAQLAAVQLPANTGAWGAYVLWLKNAVGYGEPVLLNRTRLTWMSTWLAAGATGHVFGRNLTDTNAAGGTCSVYLQHVATGTVVACQVTATTPERVSFTVPTGLDLGDYHCWAHNQHGGDWGWSERLRCTVVGRQDHIQTHEWTGSTTLTNTGGDMAGDINAALLAASQNNRCTTLRAGTWLAGKGIEARSNTYLLGEKDTNGAPLTIIKPLPGKFDPSDDRGLFGSPAPKEMLRVENILFDNSTGEAMGPVSRLLVLRRCRQVWLKNVWVVQPGGALVRLDEDTSGVYLDGCRFVGGADGIGEPIFLLPSPEAQLFVANTAFVFTSNADSAINASGASQLALLPGVTFNNYDSSVLDGAKQGKGRLLKGSGAYGVGSECWHVECNTGSDLGVMRPWLGTTQNPVRNPALDDNEGEGYMYEGAETRFREEVASATARTLTYKTAPSLDRFSGVAPGAHFVHVVRGRGMGQMRKVVANDAKGTITLDEDWRVIPDATSVVMAGTFCRYVAIVENVLSARPGMNGPNYSASKPIEAYGGCHQWYVARNRFTGFRNGLSTFTTQHNSSAFLDACSHNEYVDNVLDKCRYGVRIEATGEGGGGLPSGAGYPAPGQIALSFRNTVTGSLKYAAVLATPRSDDPGTAANFPYPAILGLLFDGDKPALPFYTDWRTTSNPQNFPEIVVAPAMLGALVLTVAAAAATVLVAADELGPLEPLPASANVDTYGLLTFPEAGQVLLNFLDTKQRALPLARTLPVASTSLPSTDYTNAQIDSFLAGKANIVSVGTGSVVKFDTQYEYPAIASGTFTVDTTAVEIGVCVRVRLEATASAPALPAAGFTRYGGQHVANKANLYAFCVAADGTIDYYIVQPA